MERARSPSFNRSSSAESEEQISRMVMPWKETLLDNLLLFGATPKGEQRGRFLSRTNSLLISFVCDRNVSFDTKLAFLFECVIYIDERWRSKGQVGKLEQYGYGYLLSQMANTPAVVSSSRPFRYFDNFMSTCNVFSLGFIEHLIDQLWIELESVPDDLTSVFPRRFPSEPISRYALKVTRFFRPAQLSTRSISSSSRC